MHGLHPNEALLSENGDEKECGRGEIGGLAVGSNGVLCVMPQLHLNEALLPENGVEEECGQGEIGGLASCDVGVDFASPNFMPTGSLPTCRKLRRHIIY